MEENYEIKFSGVMNGSENLSSEDLFAGVIVVSLSGSGQQSQRMIVVVMQKTLFVLRCYASNQPNK